MIQLCSEGDSIVRKEALFALANAAYGAPVYADVLLETNDRTPGWPFKAPRTRFAPLRQRLSQLQ